MNSKNSILLVDPEFDPNTAPNCNLLIKVTASSFSYAIIDKSSDLIKAVYDQQECGDVALAVSLQLKQDSYLRLPFKEIKVSVCTGNSLTIPNELFDGQNLDQYAQFFTEEHSGNLYVQPFGKLGITAIFAVEQLIEESLHTALESYKLFDHTAPANQMALNQSGNVLLLDFNAGSFGALYLKDGNLSFQNYYLIQNSEEFNYYLLLIIKQLNIQTADTEVGLSGIIHHGDGFYQCVEKYFGAINFLLPEHHTIEGNILDDMPAHYYSSLLALDQCG